MNTLFDWHWRSANKRHVSLHVSSSRWRCLTLNETVINQSCHEGSLKTIVDQWSETLTASFHSYRFAKSIGVAASKWYDHDSTTGARLIPWRSTADYLQDMVFDNGQAWHPSATGNWRLSTQGTPERVPGHYDGRFYQRHLQCSHSLRRTIITSQQSTWLRINVLSFSPFTIFLGLRDSVSQGRCQKEWSFQVRRFLRDEFMLAIRIVQLVETRGKSTPYIFQSARPLSDCGHVFRGSGLHRV